MTEQGKWEQLELFPEIDWEAKRLPIASECSCGCDCCDKSS